MADDQKCETNSCYNFKQSPCPADDQNVKLTVVITLNNVLVQMMIKL